jgi:uncharacterized protein
MKIRSITCFYNPNAPDQLETMGLLAKEASRQFSAAGWEVETTRLVTPPFPDLLPELSVESAVQLARRLEAESASQGFSYLSLGPALPEKPASYALIPSILAATQNTFATGIMASAAHGIVLPAVRACGAVIAQAASITSDGFANLRFAALANVPAHVPFFPAAYHSGERAAFALAIECADAAVTAFSEAASLEEGRQRLLAVLNEAGEALSRISASLARQFSVDYKGMDFSLAPFPEDCCSLAGAMERLGVPAVGLLGAVTAGAILTDTLDQGSWPRSGFNGLMLPVLEDSVMARRTREELTIKDLLLYSTVCGAGLDTVPLPGDATAEQLSALLLDVAALALRLGKPLTARLMPIPGKSAGDATEFTFGYFANGVVMALPAQPLQNFLSGNESIQLHPRQPR